MVVYLAYLRPFREQLMVEVYGKGWSDYVWGGLNGPWETDKLTSIITRETTTRLGERLTTLDYRHVAISIGRVYVSDEFAKGYKDEVGEVEEPEVDVDDGLELSAGRTGEIGVRRYGVPSEIIKFLSVRSIDVFRSLSESWHRFLGLGDDGQNPGPMRRTSQERSSRKRAREDVISCEQAAFAKRVDVHGASRRTSLDSSVKVRSAEFKRAMQKALGQTGVEFRSEEQRLAMEVVLTGERPLVVILPTGGGKSLLFMAPACLDDPGVTIVVAPFRALVNDMADRVRKRGIDCLEWRPGEVNAATVVVVSADVAGSWSFLGYASFLAQVGYLRRVIIDECHLTFTASDYRPKLAHLKRLRSLHCQMVLLTATLPPTLEDELSESMLVRDARYIRAGT
ncbi:hypothetical protein LTS18_010971, partial [Coniosporium uncinatum]